MIFGQSGGGGGGLLIAFRERTRFGRIVRYALEIKGFEQCFLAVVSDSSLERGSTKAFECVRDHCTTIVDIAWRVGGGLNVEGESSI